jgi:carboxypeptidase Q
MKHRRLRILTTLFACTWSLSSLAQADSVWIRKIFDEALMNGECHENLKVLCKSVGHRLSGSPASEKAIQWGFDLLKTYQPDSVFLQPIMVPVWERGRGETGEIIDSKGKKTRVRLAALGGSPGCPKGIEGEIVEVRSFEELDQIGKDNLKGKIVFYNRPMSPLFINTGSAYGGAVDQRSAGASKASRYGAKAVIVRSMTLSVDTFPHTGGTWYDDDFLKIPAAAISTVDANALSDRLKKEKSLRFKLQMDCRELPDKPSANVIAEWRGTEHPERIIVAGGHLDSWDIGEGAHDDGAGIVHSIEVLRILKAIGYKPRNTIRIVLYMNEENGNRGGITYADIAKSKGEFHLAAIESDAGGFSPRGFRLDGSESQYEWMKSVVAPLLDEYGLHYFRQGYSGVDIGPLKDDRVALFGLVPDSQRYFDYHHSDLDIWENVNKRELELGAASMAALVWLIDQYGFDR